MTAYSSVVVVSGVLGEEFSIDGGATFNNSLGGGTGQCARNIGAHNSPSGVGVAGQFGLFNPSNGVGVSFDGGISFTAYNVSGFYTDSRYAAFPTTNDWYITAGQWPGEGNDDAPANDDMNPSDDGFPSDDPAATPALRGNKTPKRRIPSRFRKTERLEIVRDSATGRMRPVLRLTSPNAAPTPNMSDYIAQVAVTHDGGKTFNIVFADYGNFYANGIDCEDAQHCCFCGESDSGPQPGARIYCTANGGQTWNQTLFLSGAQNSMIDLRWVAPGEYWAVGGTTSGSLSATFYHTLNGGATWRLASSIPNVYATSVDCTDNQHCWGTAVEVDQSSDVVALTSS